MSDDLEKVMSDRMFGEWNVHHTCTCVKEILNVRKSCENCDLSKLRCFNVCCVVHTCSCCYVNEMFVALVGGRTAATRPAEIMITTCDGDEDEDEPLSPSAVGDDPGMKVLLEVKSPDITPGEYGRIQIPTKRQIMDV